MSPDERWVGVEEVAAHLQVGKDSIYRWIETKGLPARRVGRLLRFRLSEVDAWVEAEDAEDRDGASSSGSQRRSSARSRKEGNAQ